MECAFFFPLLCTNNCNTVIGLGWRLCFQASACRYSSFYSSHKCLPRILQTVSGLCMSPDIISIAQSICFWPNPSLYLQLSWGTTTKFILSCKSVIKKAVEKTHIFHSKGFRFCHRAYRCDCIDQTKRALDIKLCRARTGNSVTASPLQKFTFLYNDQAALLW